MYYLCVYTRILQKNVYIHTHGCTYVGSVYVYVHGLVVHLLLFPSTPLTAPANTLASSPSPIPPHFISPIPNITVDMGTPPVSTRSASYKLKKMHRMRACQSTSAIAYHSSNNSEPTAANSTVRNCSSLSKLMCRIREIGINTPVLLILCMIYKLSLIVPSFSDISSCMWSSCEWTLTCPSVPGYPSLTVSFPVTGWRAGLLSLCYLMRSGAGLVASHAHSYSCAHLNGLNHVALCVCHGN